MADVDQEMAKIAIRTKTPLVWKRQGNKLTYSYCLTCKKVSMGDPIHFKTRHSDKICKSGWATYQDLFLAKAPVEEAEAEAEAEPVNEIVGSSEIPKDYSVCMEFFKSRNPDFAGTVEQGIFGLLKELERYKKQYEYYSNTIEQQSQKIRSIEKESGIEQAKQEYYKEKKEYQEKVEDMRREEERLRDAWGRLKTERDTAVKDLEQAKKKWDSDKKELQQDYDELEDKYKKLRRSQRDSD